MEGVVDVYEEFFKLGWTKCLLYKKNTHTCLICRQEHNRDGSYGKSDRACTENNIFQYLEQHLKLFGYSKNLAKIFIKSVRDSGILSWNVKGWWEFKEHNTEYIFVIEHCLEF